MQTAVVFGASGFIGHHVAARLSAAGWRVLAPVRHSQRAVDLLELPALDLAAFDSQEPAALARLIAGADAVINLVGVLHDGVGRPYGPGFEQAHVRLPRNLAQACVAVGVPRLLHMSALGADSQGPSMYQRSKGDGEAALHQFEQLQLTVLRPSVVFGDHDRFFNLFAALQRKLPVLLLGGCSARFAPVWVGDVAQAVCSAIAGPLASATIGRTYELGGPHVYTLEQLVRLSGQWAGVNGGRGRPMLELPPPAARLMAALLEHAPGGPLMSRDNLDSMRVDNVPGGALPGFAPELGVAAPTPVEAVVPEQLAGASAEQRLAALRAHRR